MTKNQIVIAWAQFARQVVRRDGLRLGQVNYTNFGEAMYQVVKKFGAAESVLWAGKVPSGTEDNTWVRTWLCAQGHKAYSGMTVSLDGAHASRCLSAFKQAGGI